MVWQLQLVTVKPESTCSATPGSSKQQQLGSEPQLAGQAKASSMSVCCRLHFTQNEIALVVQLQAQTDI
jgi:hypothetical protein